MAYGLKLNEIMHSTLHDLSFYDDAYAKQREIMDENMYIMGVYNFNAFSTALHNFSMIFDSKGNVRPQQYIEKPFLQKAKEKPLEEMTDEELDIEIYKAIQKEQQYMNRSKLPPTIVAKRAVV